MTTYQIRSITGITGEPFEVIIRDDGASIPADSKNVDYQAYLEWVAAGNTPTEWSPAE